MPPIRPDDPNLKKAPLPEGVFEVFNELIQKHWDGKQATIRQSEAAAAVAKKLVISQKKVYDQGLLDVEEAYREAGWKVVYDKPDWNMGGAALFIFSRES